MAKDPAVLFYTNDFLSGTFTMTDEQVGKYIRLLCLQHQKYELSEKDMLNICKTYDEDIYVKFCVQNGKYYNQKMRNETERRKKYSESRKNNRISTKDNNISKSYVKHMETETITENETENVADNGTNATDDTEEVIFNSWNAFAELKGLTKIVRLTDKRKSNIKNRLAEKDFNFDNILIRIDESPFLKGKNKEGWRVDFDFIFGNKNNYIKILEGKYSGTDKRDSGASPEQLAAIVARRFAREQEGN